LVGIAIIQWWIVGIVLLLSLVYIVLCELVKLVLYKMKY
jgi:hypothetical protein